MRTLLVHLLVGLALFLGSDVLPAQDRPRDKTSLERRFSQRYATVVREKVGLNDEQMTRLLEVNRKFESRRRDLIRREFQVRGDLRQQLAEGSTPDEAVVARLLDEALRLQRERLDVAMEEQQELAQFMSPVQRARYFGIQEQLRRRVEEMREGPMSRDSGVDDGERHRRRRPPPGRPPER